MKMHLLALAAAALLAACGGGDDSAAGTPMLTPAASADGLRRALSAVRVEAVTPEQAAEQLLNYAQVSPYASYFPGNPQTQTFGPFRFRYYPATGIYLGVVVTAGQGYTMNGVYVMGGAFGNEPALKGLVTDFITPTDPNPPGGSNNGCFDMALSEATGTRTLVEYRQTAAGQTSNLTIDTLIVGPKTFEGHSTIDVLTKTTLPIAGVMQTNELHNYHKRTGDAQITYYGSEYSSTSTVANVSTTTTASKTVGTPPWVSGFYGLAVGQSETITMNSTTTMTSTTTFMLPGVPPITQTNTSSGSTTTTTKFVGRESVTVPAGTYSACKYETTIAGVNGSSTSWYIDGKGIMVKLTGSTEGVAISQEALSVKLNGQTL